MKWAIIISFLAIAAVIAGAFLTYPAYIDNQQKDRNALDLEDRGKGKLIYTSTCSTKCHVELKFAAINNPDKYLVSDEKAVYPPLSFSTKFWFDLLYNDAISDCNGIKGLDARTRELLYTYLKNEAAENEDNMRIEFEKFDEDVEQGKTKLLADKGADVFNFSCRGCHSEHLPYAFTSIEWKYTLQENAAIHRNTDAILPEGERFDQLMAFLRKSAAANETDAEIIRDLLNKLRKTNLINNTEDADDDDNNSKFSIPEELNWHDLDWQYPYSKGLQGLLEKFPDKPIILELTNKYS